MHVLHHLLYQTQTSTPPDILTRIVLYGGLLIGLLAVAFLVFFIISRNKQNHYAKEKKRLRDAFNQQLILAQTEVQESTLSSLSKELHDNIGQLLGTVKMLMGVARRNTHAQAETLNAAEETLTAAIQELRSLSKGLNKEWLQQFSFFDNMYTETARINASKKHFIQLHTSMDALPFNADRQLILFRIVQEALNNACRHGEASNIVVAVTELNGKLQIAIEDNGKGFDSTAPANGVGLMNMRHRAAILNGQFSVDTNPKGTIVNITLPLAYD